MPKAVEKIVDEVRADMNAAVEKLLDSPPCSVDSGARESSKRTLLRHSSIHERDYNVRESTCQNGLHVYCPNKRLACEWTGSLTDVVEHMNYECQYSPVSSPLEETVPVEMPMIIMMKEFKQLKCNNERWYSPVFCTQERGYRFRLRVDANGWCDTGGAVAVVVSIVKGDYDDQLQWPFKGIITVQILNHINNSAHSMLKEFEFTDGGYECQQVTDETQPEYGCWCKQFITHKSLPYNSVTRSQYLKNNCLFFLVSYKSLYSSQC